MSDVITIGIAGGTGSGKTTITRRILDEFGGDVSVLYHDNYYKRHDDIHILRISEPVAALSPSISCGVGPKGFVLYSSNLPVHPVISEAIKTHADSLTYFLIIFFILIITFRMKVSH